MVRYYGPPSIFYTLTQDNIHGLLNLRMSLPLMYNWSFIATENGFAEALRQQKLEFQTISISESGLRMLLANGLMAAGDVFKTSMNALFSDLLCTPSDENKKKTIPLSDRPKGIFGTPVATFGVTEEQEDRFICIFFFGEDYLQHFCKQSEECQG